MVRASQSPSPEAQRSLASLCEDYWFPLYAFVRRAGHSAEDAQDMTQEFFCRLLSSNRFFEGADRTKGKFRSFLLGALRHFLADQRDRNRAQKRGGDCLTISIDSLDAETRYGLEPSNELTPERLFEKQWALSLLGHVLSKLAAEYAASGKTAIFDALKGTLGGDVAKSYADTAKELGMTEGAVKVAAHRLRRRYRELLRREILQTIADQSELQNEICHLLDCL